MGSNVKGERVQVSGTANCHRLQLLKRLHIRLYILQKVRTATNGLRLNSDQCLIRCAGVATLAIRTGIRYINWSRNRSDLQVTFISKQERQITNRVQYIFGDDTHLLISEFDSRRIDRKKQRIQNPHIRTTYGDRDLHQSLLLQIIR